MPPRKKQTTGLIENKNRTNIIAGETKELKKEFKKPGKNTNRKNNESADEENQPQPGAIDTESMGADKLFTTQPNLRAEIQTFQSLLNQLNASLLPINKDQISSIGNQLFSLSRWNTEEATQQDRTDSEGILSIIGSLLERDVETSQLDKPLLIASSQTFCQAVIALIKQYPTAAMDKDQHGLFQSHYAYELSLYILLSLVEKTAIASIFIENLTSPEIIDLLRSLSQAIPRDVFYLTQVRIGAFIILTRIIEYHVFTLHIGNGS